MNSWISQLSNDTKLSVLWTKFDFHVQVDLFMELPSKNNFYNNLLFSHHTDIICSFVCFGTSFSGMIKGGHVEMEGQKNLRGGREWTMDDAMDVKWKMCRPSDFFFAGNNCLLALCMFVWNRFSLQRRTFHCIFDF